MKPGDSAEWYDQLEPGDIIVLLQIHHQKFGLKRVTPAEAAEFPGPKYIVPPTWPNVGLFFTVEGWEEYRPAARPRPWWRFW
jgi:hypothetical protein